MEIKKFIAKFNQLEFPFVIDGDGKMDNNKAIFTKKFARKDFLKYLNSIKETIGKESYFYYGAKNAI